MVIELTSENQNLTKEGKCVVKFHAKWCGPCRVLGPIYDKASELTGVPFYSADVEEMEDLAVDYSVRNIPVVFFLNNGEVVKKLTGIINESTIKEALQELSFE